MSLKSAIKEGAWQSTLSIVTPSLHASVRLDACKLEHRIRCHTRVARYARVERIGETCIHPDAWRMGPEVVGGERDVGLHRMCRLRILLSTDWIGGSQVRLTVPKYCSNATCRAASSFTDRSLADAMQM
jgi:hypothetical protein